MSLAGPRSRSPLGGVLRGRVQLARRVLGYLRPYRLQTSVAAVCVITQSLLQLAPVLLFRALVNRLTRPHPQASGVAVLLGLGLLALLIAGLVGVVSSYLSTRVSESIVFDLRQQLFGHLLDQSVGYFTRRRGGELMAHLVTDIDGIETVLTQSLLDVVGGAILGIAMLSLMFVLDWRLALLIVVVVPSVAIPLRYAGRATHRSQSRVQEQLGNMIAYLQEAIGLSGVMLIKAFARGDVEKRRFGRINDELRDRQVHAAMTARWFGLGFSTLQGAVPIVVLLVGGILITQGASSLGTVLAFSTLIVGQFGNTLQGLGGAAIEAARSLSMWQRVFGVLDTVPEVSDRPGSVALTTSRGEVVFDQVAFSYPGSARPALRDVSVRIQPGHLVALVGPSGAGKTTFSSLMARFLDPGSGSITLDGIDLRELTVASVQRAIGIVFQDTFLFHTTLRENVSYGRPGATEEEVRQVVRDAALGELVDSLPEGLETVVGERGHRLSGGEKQRVAIARVLLKNPQILLLDEATAHLDNASERAIQAALKRAFVGRTSVVIAHRLSTVQSADVILVMEGGMIVERGTHQELFASGGPYARLHAGELGPISSARQ
jgi:ATP-binding cassette subfamily B protein